MRRRDLFATAARAATGTMTGAAVAPALLLSSAHPAQAFFGGGGVDTGAIIAALKIIEEILDSRFAEMLEHSATLATLGSVTEQLNGLLDLYARARGLFYTLDAIVGAFDRLYTAAADLDFAGLRASQVQLMSRLKILSRQAASVQASVVSASQWQAATAELLTMASRGTTSVSGQLQILNQIAGQLSSQSVQVQALLAAQTEIMAEEMAGRELVREQSAIINERFWSGFRRDDGDQPQLRLPGILD